jgi:hypothetical protein
MRALSNLVRVDQLIIDPYWTNTVYEARFDVSATQDETGTISPSVNGSIARVTTAPKFGSGHLSKPSGASFLTLGAAIMCRWLWAQVILLLNII